MFFESVKVQYVLCFAIQYAPPGGWKKHENRGVKKYDLFRNERYRVGLGSPLGVQKGENRVLLGGAKFFNFGSREVAKTTSAVSARRTESLVLLW